MKADSKKLQISMARACMNADDLQKAADVPRSTLSNVLAGKNVRPGTVGRIANTLGVDVTEILAEVAE